jgi:anti-anti-sigma factor
MSGIGRVELTRSNDTLVAQLRGELDLSNVEEIRALIVAALGNDASGLVLDLSGTTYLDSTGVRMIFDLAQRLQSRRQRLCLVLDDDALTRRVIELTKLDEQVPLRPSVDEALAALSA